MLSDFFPFALACSFIVTIPFSIATTVPYPTTSPNSTRISFPNTAEITGCPSNCSRNIGPLGSITWTGRTVTETITAETLVYVVNKKNNSTRTETITNTEVNLKNYTPLQSTKTTSVVLQFGTTSRTEILTFPSILYEDYPSSYTFCGTLPTTTAGFATCLNYPCAQDPRGSDPFQSDSPVFAYPSHPVIPDRIQNISADLLAMDPKGSTWDPVWSHDGGYVELIQPLMPDMGAWNCTAVGAWPAAASVLNTALYLTATSTSTEAGDEAGATSAPKKSPSKEVPTPIADKEPAKAEAQKAEVSQLFGNLFGVKKPAAVTEAPTHTPSSPVAVAPVPSSSQAVSNNEAGSDTPTSNPALEKPDSNAGTSPKQAAESSPALEKPDTNAGTSSKQAADDVTGSSNAPAANAAFPQEGSQEQNTNIALLALPGFSHQAATAVPAPTANAVLNVVTSSTNAQGSIIVSTSQVPGVIVTSTNAQGSQVLTTEAVVVPQVLDNPPQPTPVVVDGLTVTTNSHSQFVIAGQTLSPNSPLVLGSGASATSIILQTSGINPVLVIGSSTTTLHLPTATPTVTTNAPTFPAITIGTQTVTPNAQGQYLVAGQTLTPGGKIVVGATTAAGGTAAVGGTTVSLAPSATLAVVGTSTEGLAPFIVGGLGTGPNGTGTGGVVQFVGGAGGRRIRKGCAMAAVVGWLWVV